MHSEMEWEGKKQEHGEMCENSTDSECESSRAEQQSRLIPSPEVARPIQPDQRIDQHQLIVEHNKQTTEPSKIPPLMGCEWQLCSLIFRSDYLFS